jgi:hypothetical protein
MPDDTRPGARAGGDDMPTAADVRVFAHLAAAWLDGAGTIPDIVSSGAPYELSYRNGYLSQMLSSMAKGQLSIQQASRQLKDRVQPEPWTDDGPYPELADPPERS